MTDDLTADQKREYNGSQALEVIDTDSGRKPIWGIAALVALVAAGVFVVWFSIAKATDTPAQPSVTPSTTTASVIAEAPNNGAATTSERNGSTTATTIFFFAMLGAMTLVGVRIYLGARRIYRASHPPSPPATP